LLAAGAGGVELGAREALATASALPADVGTDAPQDRLVAALGDGRQLGVATSGEESPDGGLAGDVGRERIHSRASLVVVVKTGSEPIAFGAQLLGTNRRGQ
jgi:hypothetical protein